MLLRKPAPPTAAPATAETVAQGLAEAAAAAAREDWEAALVIWSHLGHAGVAKAQAEIGRCFVNGWGVARDTALAERWLTLAAQAGDALGQRLLGDFHFNGEGGAPNRAIAEEWYARAARQSDAHAQDMLSWILTDGDHRKPDYSQAMQWALKAAGQGVAASMTRIGLLHNNALGVERDVAAAARWWRKAALLGDADGQAMLGVAHHLGAGVARDPVAALAWLTRARAARSPFADRFYVGVRQSCTAEQIREAERRAGVPLDPGGGGAMIVGTAGHIDHGKTSLVRRLTGVDTDRLKEEKKRGISIDLGFAYWPRPGGEIVGFVDVPGHEGLVHNMLAGATGIDFVILVVAADDGVMPQTREHLAIMNLLGLRHGVVALNKCDLAGEDQRAAAVVGIQAVLAGTGLEGAPIVPVLAITGEGLAELTAHLDAALARRTARPKDGLFRLAVDRSFTLTGLGTAVTGTVLSGAVRVEDRVTVSPSGLEARVRSINAQDRPVERGEAGQRCALVLTGAHISKEAVRRGDVVLDPVLHAPTARINVSLRVLASERRPIGQWFPVKVHHAATEVPGRVVVLRDAPIAPGEAAYVQLVLERPLAAAVGDRFVVRDTSSSRTVGGGSLIDLRAPERRRRTPERHAEIAALARPDPAEALGTALLGPLGWLDLNVFCRDRALAPSAAARLVSDLALVVLQAKERQMVALPATWERLQARIGSALDQFHSDRPDLPGIGIEQLRVGQKPALPAPLFLSALRRLAEAGELVLNRTWVRRPGHEVRFSPEEERIWALIRPRLAGEPYRPPRVRDIAKDVGIDEGFVRRLMRLAAQRGDVEEIAHDHFFLRSVVERMAEIAIDVAAHAADGKFTAAEFRDRLDNGRKVAIQILEFFDRHGFTIRRQDLRRINPARIDLFAPRAAPADAQADNGGVPLPVERPDFKSGWGRQTVPGGFDSHPPPPTASEGRA